MFKDLKITSMVDKLKIICGARQMNE